MSVKKIFLLTFFTLILACNVDDDDLINKENNELNSYNVGIIPGDFAFWKSE